MTLGAFLLSTIAISMSGVLAPGPMTAVTVGKGSESPHAGALVAIGHAVIEFPLMAAIFYGAGKLIGLLPVRIAITLLGGTFLLFMGIGMLRSIKSAAVAEVHDGRSPLVAGIVLSAGNPYFLIWWAAVGASLIMQAVGFGIAGFAAFAVTHWLCDFVWLYFLSALSFAGGRFFGLRFQRVLFAVCGVLLVIFSGKFFYDGVSLITGKS
jgi:threonine/homoserine/homoserine lactone efflux protein